ncbi:16S rRNA (cytosine(1402)-N(4))-methyltransferase, partial [Phytoactinopolyspora endophytica]|uniref:16S rRNA (cytosine(1402)-N(4))-methyltransferase n=1 Tax=Phytoactinopolyspora endophytica TaxID=1642495 RepID=UPI0030B85613
MGMRPEDRSYRLCGAMARPMRPARTGVQMSEREAPGAGHVPVMLDRVVELLTPALQAAGSIAVDATLGLGGHSEELLRQCPQTRVIGLDRDPQ